MHKFLLIIIDEKIKGIRNILINFTSVNPNYPTHGTKKETHSGMGCRGESAVKNGNKKEEAKGLFTLSTGCKCHEP